MSHGKEKGAGTWDISETVLQRCTVPGVSGIAATEDRACLPQMWLSSWISAVQRAVPVRHQTSVTARTVLHKTHMPLTQWFLASYFASQDKRGISAVQLAAMLGTTYKTAWFILWRIRIAIGRRDGTHQLCGVIEFDDAYFGSPTVGKKRGRGTEKAKVFVALSLDDRGDPRFLKMRVTPNIKQASVRKFAHTAFDDGSVIHSDGYCSYIPALEGYPHEYKPYDSDSGLLHCL